MKKIAALALALIFCMVAAGCTDNSRQSEAEKGYDISVEWQEFTPSEFSGGESLSLPETDGARVTVDFYSVEDIPDETKEIALAGIDSDSFTKAVTITMNHRDITVSFAFLLDEENMALSNPYSTAIGRTQNVGHFSVSPLTGKASRQTPAHMRGEFSADDGKISGNLDFYLTEEGIATISLEMHKDGAQ